jgi:hypothetical protein
MNYVRELPKKYIPSIYNEHINFVIQVFNNDEIRLNLVGLAQKVKKNEED